RGGMYIKPNDMPAPPNWMPYAHVPSADKGFALAKSAGAREMMAPMDVPGGSRIAAVLDPAGAMFAVHSMPATPATVQPAPKAKAKAKAKAKVKPKAKMKPKAKVAKKKPAAKKKVVRKAAKKVTRK